MSDEDHDESLEVLVDADDILILANAVRLLIESMATMRESSLAEYDWSEVNGVITRYRNL